MDVRVLASGSGGNAYTLTEGGSTLLLEAGIRFKDLQRALRFKLSSLDGVLCSHEHADHAKALPHLMKAGVDCYATNGTLQALGLKGHRAKVITPLEPIDIGLWRVLAFPAVHDAVEPVGFVIANASTKLLYLTDSAYCPYRFDGLTHLMIETNFSMEILQRNLEAGRLPAAHMARVIRNHLSLERALGLLKANDLSRVERITLLHMSNSNADEASFCDAVRRATGIPTYAAAERATA